MPDEEAEDGVATPWPVWPESFAESPADLRAALVLSALGSATPRRLLALAVEHGTASAVLAEVREGRTGSPRDRALAREVDAAEIVAAASACGARVDAWGSDAYPPALRHIHDPPMLLFAIGRPVSGTTPFVAVVGARRCTELGREVARELGRGLGLAGATVVSGAALGIDAAAHEGTLDAGGRTVAVMGCGVDVAYPAASRRLIERIRRSGTILSEHPPGTPPLRRNFPARNRIVAGLCGATVVVEGAEGSGSMITADHAMEFGRDVYALPGPVTSPLSSVPLQLIRDGASMIRGAEDLLTDLGLQLEADRVADRAELSVAERRVLERLTGPTLPDRLAGDLDASVPEVLGLLMRLELRGFVRSIGGRYESTLRGAAAPA